MHGLTPEVRSKRTFAIRTIEKRFVSVCTESTRKHSNVTKDGFPRRKSGEADLNVKKENSQRLIEDIGHLVLEVLGRDKRVDEVDTVLPLKRHDFTASSTDV